MVTAKRFHSDQRSEWDEFVSSARARLFFFQRTFMEYHSDRFHDESVMFYKDDRLVGIFPASRHGDELRSHGGLTFGGLVVSSRTKATDVLDCIDALVEYGIRSAVGKILYKAVPYIFHEEPSQEDLYALCSKGARLVRRDLSSVIHLSARGRVSKGRKYMVKKAEQEQVTVVRSDNWEGFHQLLSEVLAQHGVSPTHSSSELVYLASRFPENIELRVALKANQLLAGTVLFHFDKVVHTQYIATSDDGKQVGALDLLLESAIQDSTEAGKPVFSFGISTEKGGTVLNEGLIAHKEAFGARGVALDHYELILTHT